MSDETKDFADALDAGKEVSVEKGGRYRGPPDEKGKPDDVPRGPERPLPRGRSHGALS